MARICREAGARVRTNVMVRDLDLGAFKHLDGRRLEIIADGLPLWRGAQLAIDTTLVSHIRADGTATRHAAHRDGVALEEARKTKERKYPELVGNGGRASLVVVAPKWGGGSLLRQPSFCAVLFPRKSAACLTQGEGCCDLVAQMALYVRMRGCELFRVVPPWPGVLPGADGEVPLLSDVFGADQHG